MDHNSPLTAEQMDIFESPGLGDLGQGLFADSTHSPTGEPLLTDRFTLY